MDLSREIAALRGSESVLEAARKLDLKPATLKKRFERAGLRPSDFTSHGEPAASTPPEPPDPVAEHLAARARKIERSERSDLIERLAAAEARADFVSEIRGGAVRSDTLQIGAREFGSGVREATAIALLSDAHIEESVRAEAVSGRNSYDLEISERRMARFFAGFRWLINHHRGDFQIRDAILWLGGDLITGAIHDELIESNALAPVDAILELKRRLVAGIRYLLEDPQLASLVIPCNVGNHGRTTAKRRVKTLTENSYEWLLYNVLADEFASEPRVTFVIPRSAHTYVTAYDFKLHFHHGDEVRYWGGVGGLSIPLNKRIPRWDNVKSCDYHHVGHFHQFIDLGRVIVNGSVIGYTEYAMSAGCDFEPPQQAFYLLDSKRGKTSVTPIWVEG